MDEPEQFRGTVVDAGRRATKVRQALGLSQAMLAERAGVSESFVAELEQGRCADAQYGQLVAVLEALGVIVEVIHTQRPKGLVSTRLHEHVANINVDSPLARRRRLLVERKAFGEPSNPGA